MFIGGLLQNLSTALLLLKAVHQRVELDRVRRDSLCRARELEEDIATRIAASIRDSAFAACGVIIGPPAAAYEPLASIVVTFRP